MDEPRILFTAVFMEANGGYVGFVEELPGINCTARTLAETRRRLAEIAAVVFEEERSASAALLDGKDVVREPLVLTPATGPPLT
jgi:predicted RNase H-like HicB family nuclease